MIFLVFWHSYKCLHAFIWIWLCSGKISKSILRLWVLVARQDTQQSRVCTHVKKWKKFENISSKRGLFDYVFPPKYKFQQKFLWRYLLEYTVHHAYIWHIFLPNFKLDRLRTKMDDWSLILSQQALIKLDWSSKLGCVILPKVLKNIGIVNFPITLALRTSPSEKFSKKSLFTIQPSRSKFYSMIYQKATLVQSLGLKKSWMSWLDYLPNFWGRVYWGFHDFPKKFWGLGPHLLWGLGPQSKAYGGSWTP